MPRAVLLGGTGAIGRATAARLLRAGWEVDLTGRERRHVPAALTDAGARFTRVDRDDPAAPLLLRTLVGDGADLLLDATCATAADAARLLPLAADATSTVVLSTKAVYADPEGRHGNSDDPPRFRAPVTEDQPTVPAAVPGGPAPGSREGYGAHKVAAEQVLLASGLPVTVLRPSKVHGAGARQPRTWVLVARVLDGRSTLLLRDPDGINHTSAAVDVAALVQTVATRPGRRVLNAADPDAPSVVQIARAVAGLLGHAWDEVVIDARSGSDALGTTPWDAPHPIVLDTSAATDLGHRPVGSFAETVAEEVTWLVEAARGGDEAHLLPAVDDPFFAPLLDLAVEDAHLSAHRR